MISVPHMNDAATRPAEFGTGLRARIAHGRGLDARGPSRSSQDLVRLCAGRAVEKPGAEPTLVSRDRVLRGHSGAFAA